MPTAHSWATYCRVLREPDRQEPAMTGRSTLTSKCSLSGHWYSCRERIIHRQSTTFAQVALIKATLVQELIDDQYHPGGDQALVAEEVSSAVFEPPWQPVQGDQAG